MRVLQHRDHPLPRFLHEHVLLRPPRVNQLLQKVYLLRLSLWLVLIRNARIAISSDRLICRFQLVFGRDLQLVDQSLHVLRI